MQLTLKFCLVLFPRGLEQKVSTLSEDVVEDGVADIVVVRTYDILCLRLFIVMYLRLFIILYH